jgi:uncharacterized membrane protein
LKRSKTQHPEEELQMYKLALVLCACVTLGACSPTTTGSVAGATTGAIIGGPVGAVVGGVGGAAAGATAGAATGARVAQASPGYCYVYDRNGRMVMNASGNPRLRRC